jgi:hypothetical protein
MADAAAPDSRAAADAAPSEDAAAVENAAAWADATVLEIMYTTGSRFFSVTTCYILSFFASCSQYSR